MSPNFHLRPHGKNSPSSHMQPHERPLEFSRDSHGEMEEAGRGDREKRRGSSNSSGSGESWSVRQEKKLIGRGSRRVSGKEGAED